ncbi:50S ribosomal protein L11 methyltransferase [Sphingomonas carotinifaciens]|uniref:Ribosomal protein L11 methyltransferase n=1 Tax=Sphingomonas carotinifaciens TaxID=1166323 RepID=A0A1G7KUT4_9SPHN|nr:50S ribosomal protein L11 methyltransferase [Sphingomonas carotinifaciens]MBB4085415.1 ribosomal protein L11 methyltransferase [Sphingomonas carotinifaciens]MWC43561.1 methyltransferase [Sphingomonas carotinifaciens]SDF40983.1 [LSU ribosomal protein L11P]-lysine N-methyltransferase [Sphingomonas carotinifaciens]
MSWKLTLPCTRAEAEAIDAADDLGLDAAPVLMTTETVEDDTETWRLDAYFEDEPGAAAIAAVRALVPSASDTAPAIEELGDQDWVTMSQSGLEPLRVGRFFVHTSAHPAEVPEGGRAFLIEAGQAFGTGHHETTSGCLAMLDAMAGTPVSNAIDVGTGTGLLAFAVRHLWPDAAVMATDIDPMAIIVTRENAQANAIDRVECIVADGALDDAITAAAPYDLVIANILAGPLVSMAPELAAIAAPNATILLAGLLETQRDDVTAAYAARGCTVEAVDRRGDWSVLRLMAGAERYVPAAPFDPKGRDGWALDL